MYFNLRLKVKLKLGAKILFPSSLINISQNHLMFMYIHFHAKDCNRKRLTRILSNIIIIILYQSRALKAPKTLCTWPPVCSLFLRGEIQ